MDFNSTLTKKQTRTFGPRLIDGWGAGATITAEARWDDECGNGHNSFAITGEIRVPHRRDCEACGCLHDEIAASFPELAPLLKWHFCGSDGPMHYIQNTIFLAGDRDCWGLKIEERRQNINGKTKLPTWELVALDADGEPLPTYKLPKYVDAAEAPASAFRLEWRPWCRIGEGKARKLDAARRSAVWPDATDEDLTAPGLRERLEARLPALMAEFRAAVESLGFVW